MEREEWKNAEVAFGESYSYISKSKNIFKNLKTSEFTEVSVTAIELDEEQFAVGTIQNGVYIGSSGPMLETPAEYRLFRTFGADATGMSTVPEVIAAHHMGIKVFGMSIITNVSEKENPEEETTHDEVQNVAGVVEPKMSLIITELIRSL